MSDAIAVHLSHDGAESMMMGLQSRLAAIKSRHGDPVTVFGLHLCSPGFGEVADLIIHTPRTPQAGVGVVATANIQHIATMRVDPEFRAAMGAADIVTCDGFPVFRYASYRGCDMVGRTTGREIVAAIMDKPIGANHRLFFVVDSQETGNALLAWARQRGMEDRVGIEIPPQSFIRDHEFCNGLAHRVGAFETTLLFLCVGAPQSEIFAHRYRRELPACWALCVGQSVRITLGLNPMPPRIVEKMNVEWLWRMWLEPRRLVGRYASSGMGFCAAILEDSIARRNSTA